MSGTFIIVLHLLIILNHKQPHEVSNIIISRQGYQAEEKLNSCAKVACESNVNIWAVFSQNLCSYPWYRYAESDHVHFAPLYGNVTPGFSSSSLYAISPFL
jgi:hypothetical protein